MATKRIKDLTTTATEADLVSGNYLALDGANGTKKLPGNCVAPKSIQDNLIESIAPVFDATANYTAGQSVMYQGKLYTFKVDHPAGAWDASHVDATNTQDYIEHCPTINTFRAGDFIPVKGLSGTAKIGKTDLLKATTMAYGTNIDSVDVANAAFSSDFDNAVVSKVYRIVLASGIANCPASTPYGSLIVFAGMLDGSGMVTQLFVSQTDHTIYYRYRWGGTWVNWGKMADLDDALSAYDIVVDSNTTGTEAFGSPMSFNNARANKIYRITLVSGIDNCPASTSEGMLIVFAGMRDGSGINTQLFVSKDSGKLYYRYSWGYNWNPWHVVNDIDLGPGFNSGVSTPKILNEVYLEGYAFNVSSKEILSANTREKKLFLVELPKIKGYYNNADVDVYPSYISIENASSMFTGGYSQVFFFNSSELPENEDLTSKYVGSGRVCGTGRYSCRTINQVPSGSRYALISADQGTSTVGSTIVKPVIHFYYPHDKLSYGQIGALYDDVLINKEESKKVVYVGGSVSNFWLTSQGTNEELLYQLPIDNQVNLAMNGYGCSEARVENFYSRLYSNQSDVSSADIVVLWLSTNDYRMLQPRGDYRDCTIYDNYDLTKTNSQCGGFNHCVKYIRDLNPDAQILCFLPLKFFEGYDSYDANSTVVNTTGYNFYNYTREVEKCCKLQGIPVLDLWDALQLGIENYSSYFLDTLHPNEAGYQRINKQVLEFMRKFV